MITNPSNTTVSFGVTGMTCDHCVASVTEEIGRLAGVDNVSVELVPGGVSTVKVTSARSVAVDEFALAIDEAGYELAAAPR